MKANDEPAFAVANDNNDAGALRRYPPLPPDASAVSLEDGDAVVVIVSDRVSSVVDFKPNTCTVPLSLETASQCAFGEKAML